LGLNQGMQPIAGYNYGARQYSRVRSVYLVTAAWATLILVFGFIVCEFFPGLTVSAFTNDPALKEIATRGIRIMNCAFPIIGFQMVGTNLFQSLGMVNKSIFLSLTRQLIFLVPAIYLLPLEWGLDGIWYSYPVSDTLASIITAILLIGLLRKLNRMKDGDDPTLLGSTL
ncbi:MAG: MATE family efflux transporter, partial [Bacteroidales bacterium]|nr:MATE family efflux transporter [Bacteroidales bacterium]